MFERCPIPLICDIKQKDTLGNVILGNIYLLTINFKFREIFYIRAGVKNIQNGSERVKKCYSHVFHNTAFGEKLRRSKKLKLSNF